MKKLKIGFIGLGARGLSLLKDVVLTMSDIEVVSVCDFYEDRSREGAAIVGKACGMMPAWETDYKKVVDASDVQAVIIAASWEMHVEMAVYAMQKGKAVGMEVGGAFSIEDCWDLVNTYEKTKTPFMFLENCCFGQREMMVLNMANQGVFGDIVHCAGGYHHDLREEIANGAENRHYRLKNYMNRNAENYPTHELGPIAKILNVNHGNRLVSLTSTASKAAGLHEYICTHKSEDEKLKNTIFQQGDIVTTVIKCAHGETITLTLDTTLPRYYSRGFTIRGTKGLYEEATDSVFLDTQEDREFDFSWRANKCGNAEEYAKTYEHPTWKWYKEKGVQGTHDGMDWLEFRVFFDCLINQEPMPIDVYDAATWMAVTALSEQSIALGSVPVMFPDFTKGKWLEEKNGTKNHQ